MVLRLTSSSVFLLFIYLGYAQNHGIRVTRQNTLQNAIDYTSQFASQQGTSPQFTIDQLETNKLENDPIVRSLFKEFLVQYQQFANKEKSEVSFPTTTTETPYKQEYTSLFTSPTIQYFTTPFPNVPTPQKRRLSPRRKINTPLVSAQTFNNYITSSTTPFPNLLNRVNSLHQDSVETTTTPSLLKQRFFGINTSNSKKSHATEKTIFPPTTSSAPERKVELPKAIPNVKIPQRLVNFPSKPAIASPKKETATTKTNEEPKFDEEEFRRQAANAKYEFASDIDDEINGNLHQREEVRDGLTVKGRYTFSDGYFKRTVHYVADDKGYRVIEETVEPLDGPQANPDGQARVSSYVAGNAFAYQITKDDLQKRNQQTVFQGRDDEIETE